MAQNTNQRPSLNDYHSQSWQIEILIAGGILFSLYNFGDVLRAYFLKVEPLFEITSHIMILFFGAYVLTTILLVGFGANLILRAVWLAYLGISYAFPEGVQYDNLRASEKLKTKLKRSLTATDRVLLLEKWSKLSFSFAILISLFIVSLIITVSFTIWGINLIFPGLADRPSTTYIVVFFMAVVQLGVFDQLFVRKKETGFWSRVTKVASRIFHILTLSFLYRREALVLKTNVNKWVLYSFALLYITVAILASVNRIGEFYTSGTFNVNLLDERENYDIYFRTQYDNDEYENMLGEDDTFSYGGIQSDIVSDDYLKLFIVYRKRFDKQLFRSFRKAGLATRFPDSLVTYDSQFKFLYDENKKFQRGLNDFFKVTLDSTELKSVKWAVFKHPKTEEEGYITYLKIDTLSKDQHAVDLDLRFEINGKSERQDWLTIPFWKQ